MKNYAANPISPSPDLARQVLDHSVDGLLVIDKEGIVRFANPAAIALFKDHTEALVGLHFGTPAIHEPAVEIILPGGEIQYVEMRATQIEWEGKPATLANLRDISDRKQAEEALRKQADEIRRSESQFRSLVEGAPFTVAVVAELILSYVNPAGCRLFGAQSPEQILYRSILDRIHPSQHRLILERIHKVFDKTEPAPTVEQTWLRLDGRAFPVEVSSVPISYEGKDGALAFAYDITARKNAEELLRRSEDRYRSILEAAPDAALLINAEGAIVLMNSQAEAMFGHPREALLGCDSTCLFAKGYRSGHVLRRDAYFAHFESQKQGEYVDIVGLRADGTEFPIEARTSPIQTEKERLLLAAFRDLTDQRAAELHSRLLQTAVSNAEAANKAKSMFLSTMSHEIRTPMNAILGYSQLMLRDSELSASARASLKIINRSGEHLMEIINNILDMAKIEAGHLQLTPKPFFVPTMVRDLEAMFRLRAETKALRFDVQLADASTECIVADEGKVGQVLMNLLENAVKFTERGRVTLRISTRPRADGRLRFSAEVEDTGIGISPEDQSKLFLPFAQNESGQQVHPGGTGLGLAISQGIARAMGGDLTVSSQPGRGSTFLFDVPVEAGSGYEALAFGAGSAGSVTGGKSTGGRVTGIDSPAEAPRILVADDVPESRAWLSSLLGGVGFPVRAVENGKAAFDAWRDWKPRLILMDMHMPVMAGLEATLRIRAHPRGKDTVIIALTADAMESHRREALENGLDDFISKPCAEEELLEKIGAHLGIVYIRSQEYIRSHDPGTRAANAEAGMRRDESGRVLPDLPSNLVRRMRKAILHGDKVRLDQLIERIADQGEVQWASTLSEMADMYQYDRLTEWLDRL